MSLIDSVKTLLAQYSGGSPSDESAATHFDQLAQSAGPGMLASGISAAMRSDQTPAFGDIVSQLFANGTGTQKAGMLSALLSAASPDQRAQLAGMLNGAPADVSSVNEQHVAGLSPQDVGSMAKRVEAQNPGIIDTMSSFYAQHPMLVKTLGTAAMMIAMRKIAEQHQA
jgi:hypothetical protein